MKALFIGRFQPFHNGHLQVIQKTLDEFAFLYIGIGSSQYENTFENPFSYTERKIMIEKALSEEENTQVNILSIPDIHDPAHWVDHVCAIINDFDVVISNNSFTSQLFQEKGYEIKKTGLYKRDSYSGKEIRQRMISGRRWDDLVPPSVATYLFSIDAVNRLKRIHEQSEPLV
jgi:nicotinamide-nucleotide adenylyltransferase